MSPDIFSIPNATAENGMNSFVKAERPTLYFIGMTTGKSSIMSVFPRWAEYLGLKDAVIRGIDCKWHDAPEAYRQVVAHIKQDPLSLGALVTTHKIDLFKACRDLFDELDPYAQLTGEVSCISKSGKRLVGHAKDPISSSLALEAFLSPGHWEKTGAEAVVLGAGGSSIAITCHMMDRRHGMNRPSRIIVTNRSLPRLEEMRYIHQQLDSQTPVEYVHAPNQETNDAVVSALKPHSLVANATGLGKDAPGSPIGDAARFPEFGFAWDFNYRGNLLFLDQARSQSVERQLTVEDGWIYFIHGWTQVIAEVFHRDIPTRGPVFEDLSRIAAETRI